MGKHLCRQHLKRQCNGFSWVVLKLYTSTAIDNAAYNPNFLCKSYLNTQTLKCVIIFSPGFISKTMLKALLYRPRYCFPARRQKEAMGWDKIKTVIRYSWVLDNNGIKGPQIAKRKKASQSSFNYKNLERESQWQFLVEHSRSQYEHKWQKHCRVAFKYKNYKRFCLIYVICFCNLRM